MDQDLKQKKILRITEKRHKCHHFRWVTLPANKVKKTISKQGTMQSKE